MNTVMASDEVTDSIAHIEMHRQEMAKETDLAAACGESLRKLHELLEHERAALQLHSSSVAHLANVEAATLEIQRIKQMTGAAPYANSLAPRSQRAQQPAVSRSRAPHTPTRNKLRRTMGRRSER
jgi:bacterioferritin-associated ferredoxin